MPLTIWPDRARGIQRFCLGLSGVFKSQIATLDLDKSQRPERQFHIVVFPLRSLRRFLFACLRNTFAFFALGVEKRKEIREIKSWAPQLRVLQLGCSPKRGGNKYWSFSIPLLHLSMDTQESRSPRASPPMGASASGAWGPKSYWGKLSVTH